jgi:hypothetical protein
MRSGNGGGGRDLSRPGGDGRPLSDPLHGGVGTQRGARGGGRLGRVRQVPRESRRVRRDLLELLKLLEETRSLLTDDEASAHRLTLDGVDQRLRRSVRHELLVR